MKIAVTWGTEEGEICESVRHGFSVRAGGMKGSRENSLIWRGEVMVQGSFDSADSSRAKNLLRSG
jgi:hypothetical protein